MGNQVSHCQPHSCGTAGAGTSVGGGVPGVYGCGRTFKLPPEVGSVICLGEGGALPYTKTVKYIGVVYHTSLKFYVAVCHYPCWVGPEDKDSNGVCQKIYPTQNGVRFRGIRIFL